MKNKRLGGTKLSARMKKERKRAKKGAVKNSLKKDGESHPRSVSVKEKWTPLKTQVFGGVHFLYNELKKEMVYMGAPQGIRYSPFFYYSGYVTIQDPRSQKHYQQALS